MKGVLQLALVVILAMFAATASAQEAQFFVPDTDFCLGDEEDCESGDAPEFHPDEIAQHSGGLYYQPAEGLTLPGFVQVDCLHKLYDPGQWLFSPKNPLSATDGSTPDPLALAVGQSIQFNDIVRYDGAGNYSFFFKGQEIPPGASRRGEPRRLLSRWPGPRHQPRRRDPDQLSDRRCQRRDG